jgi:hypothetical protein
MVRKTAGCCLFISVKNPSSRSNEKTAMSTFNYVISSFIAHAPMQGQ